MYLRFKIKQPIFLYGLFKESLDLSARFKFKHFQVSINLDGGEPTEATWSGRTALCQWYRKTSGVQVVLQDDGDSDDLRALVTGGRHDELLSLIFKVSLKILRVIRNVGIEPEIPETLPSTGSSTKQLVRWDIETSDDGTHWVELFTPPTSATERIEMGYGIFGTWAPPGFSMNAELGVHEWDNITEVLEDNREPSPEDEFLTNTIGHMRASNYRLALLEAVIGLEIVLTRFLESHLEIGKRVPKQRIKKFLRTDLGLTARISAILDLTVHESYLKDMDLDAVLQAIEWRNGIVHRTGKLPENVPEEKIRDTLTAVTKTARTLAEIRQDIVAAPDKIHILQRLKKAWENVIGTIWVKAWHHIMVRLEVFGAPPNRDDMERLASLVSDLLKARDKRFDPSVHLRIEFVEISGRPLGVFWFGKLFPPGEDPHSLLLQKRIKERQADQGKSSGATGG